MSIAALLRERAQRHPANVALLASDRTPLTYGTLWSRVESLAIAFAAAGMPVASRVALIHANGVDAAVAFLAIASRAACIPLNPQLQSDELRFLLQDAGVHCVVVAGDDQSAARQIVRDLRLTLIELSAHVDGQAGASCVSMPPSTPVPSVTDVRTTYAKPEDVALVLHTSGTTARPKLVPLTQANLLASARSIATTLALTAADRCLNVMPLFHVHGLIGNLLAPLAAGASVICEHAFAPPPFFRALRDLAPTWYSAVPTIHQAVACHAEESGWDPTAGRLRFVRSSSASLPPATLRALERSLGVPVIEAYSMTEASHQMTSNPLPPGARKVGSVGLPAGAEVAVIGPEGKHLPRGTVGEVVVRGPAVMAGYGGDPRLTQEAFVAGWFRTGDLGRLDDDGYLFIAGRVKEIVNRGGEKVSPREIDEALLECAGVAQAAAFGVPHPTLGEDLVAVVVPMPHAHLDEPTLRAHLFNHIAANKVPTSIVAVAEIPKGPTGKVQRSALAAKLAHLFKPPYVAPGSELERRIAAHFGTLLRHDRVGAHDNFFSLGGDSLKGTQLMVALQSELGIALPATTVFHHPSVAALARVVEQALTEVQAHEAALAEEIAALSDEEVAALLAQEGDQPIGASSA